MSCRKPRTFLKKVHWGTCSGPPKNSPMKLRVFAVRFLWKKKKGQAYGKNNQPTQALTHVWRRQFSPEDDRECFQTEVIQPIFCYSERNSNISGPPCKLLLLSMALLPPPAGHTLLKNNSLWFAVLFYFSSQKIYCYSVNVFLLSYFADDFLPIFGGLNLPLVTLFAPLWSPLRRLTLSLKKLGQGQTTAWLWTLTSL